MKIFRCFLIAALLPLTTEIIKAQALDYQNVITVILEDGTHVVCYGRAGEERMQKTLSVSNNMRGSFSSDSANAKRKASFKVNSSLPDLTYGDDYYFTGDYYYLPTNLRLSKRKDGVPEFLFLKYTTDERTDAGGIQGALMHFLMEWGLTPAQEAEAEKKLQAKVQSMKTNPGMGEKFAKVTKPNIVGPVRVQPGEESFRIISGTLSDKTLTSTVVTSGKAANMPGSKMAVASNLSKNGAQLLAATFEKTRSITDVSVELRFKYNVLLPAFKAMVTIDYTKLQTMYQDKYKKSNKRDEDDKDDDNNSVTVTDRESLIENMLSAKVVDIAMTDMGTNSQTSKTIVDAIMNLIIASMETDKGDNDRRGNNNEPGAPDPGVPHGSSTFDLIKLKAKMARGKEVINLNYRMAISEEISVTGNLGSWYSGVKNNPKCVGAVNLNDPFFQHRDINVILDVEAEEMMGKEMNYVTVNIRKRRGDKDAEDFQHDVTFDRKFMEANGNRATVTYSKAQDDAPDVYEYKVQWSLRGGNVFPKGDTTWTKGSWQGITLAPPVAPSTIRFEADQTEMKDHGIKNVTLQLRYKKFGSEVETNISINGSGSEATAIKTIFMDRNTRGYAYRLVFYDKDLGPIATPWDAKINTEYVYATIPKEIRDKNQEWINKGLEAAKVILQTDNSGAITKEQQVLDKFQKVLEVVTDGKSGK